MISIKKIANLSIMATTTMCVFSDFNAIAVEKNKKSKSSTITSGPAALLKAKQYSAVINAVQPSLLGQGKLPVKTTKSGLQYFVLESGKGANPKITDTVSVDYHGQLVNGHVFDSSYNRGQPASFPLGQVIPGWTEMVSNMKIGETVVVYIPAVLAYGASSPSPDVPPNSPLVFLIHLISKA
jgi:FKBP-type peptidyl-prolyl cis-trans isomerase